jgi:hypothetical protein
MCVGKGRAIPLSNEVRAWLWLWLWRCGLLGRLCLFGDGSSMLLLLLWLLLLCSSLLSSLFSTAGVRGRQRVSCACACGRSAGALPRRALPGVRHRPPPAPRPAALHARHQCRGPP